VPKGIVYQEDFNTYEEAVKKHGAKQAYAWLVQGYRNMLAHKKQNTKRNALLELAKNDPRFKDLTLEQMEERTKALKAGKKSA
jgi:hypothetical protein